MCELARQFTHDLKVFGDLLAMYLGQLARERHAIYWNAVEQLKLYIYPVRSMESFTISKVLQEFYNINSVLQPAQFVSYMLLKKKKSTPLASPLPGYITILNSSNFLSKSLSRSAKGVVWDRAGDIILEG